MEQLNMALTMIKRDENARRRKMRNIDSEPRCIKRRRHETASAAAAISCEGRLIKQEVDPIGAFDEEEAAARAYDLAALKYWGTSTFTNFPISDYEKEIEIMQTVTKEEYLASLRRKSSGFSRGISKYRGVARHHHNGRWEARIGRVYGNKYLYLGTYSTQEEAAHAYDIAAIEYRGVNAVTNFDLSTYIRWLKPGVNDSVSAQEQNFSPDLQALFTSLSSCEESSSPCSKNRAFNGDYLSKTESFARNIPISSCRKSSSPTALGLLLQSSIFRELVEKNLNVPEENDDENKSLLEVSSDDENGKIFYDGNADIPFALSSNGHGIELQGQVSADMIGNGIINMIPMY